MPIYRTGKCYLCGEKSNYLLPEIGFTEGHFIVGNLCEACRSCLKMMREENGDFDLEEQKHDILG